MTKAKSLLEGLSAGSQETMFPMGLSDPAAFHMSVRLDNLAVLLRMALPVVSGITVSGVKEGQCVAFVCATLQCQGHSYPMLWYLSSVREYQKLPRNRWRWRHTYRRATAALEALRSCDFPAVPEIISTRGLKYAV